MLQTDKRFCNSSRIFFICGLTVFIAIAFHTAILFFSTRHIILVEDKIFETYIEHAWQSSRENKRLIFKPLSSLSEKSRLFATSEIPVAIITSEENFSLISSATIATASTEQKIKIADGASSIFYCVGESVLVPSVPANIQTAGKESSKEASTLSPQLSVSITSPGDVPKNFRALPANGFYAGDANYPLVVKSFVRCTILQPQFAKAVAECCASIFEPFKPKQKQTAFVASVGDLMVARGVQDILMRDKNGLQKVFGTTLPILQNNDITIGNLEGAVTESEKALQKTYRFKFQKEVLPYLKAAGFNYLMLANNHCYDYGEDGFRNTLNALAEYAIPTSGAGATIDEAEKFYRTEKKGQRFSIISCGMYPVEMSGFNGKQTATATKTRAGILWASDKLLAAVAEEKKSGAFVIVNVHGGNEYQFTPSKAQRDFYEALSDAGADAVFGSHPHVLQPVVWHKNSLIAYSLGNFIFNGMDGLYGATDTAIIRLGVYGGKILYEENYPAKIEGTGVRLK